MEDSVATQIEKFKKILAKSNTETIRFNINNYIQDVPTFLKISYVNEVQKRGKEFIEDEYISKCIIKASKWLEGNNKIGLMLKGNVGNGKSTLAYAMANMINICSGYSAYVESISAMDLSTLAKDNPAEFEKKKKAKMLSIDDVGCEPREVKSWGTVINPFLEIIYYRYDKQLFTILSTNFDDEDFKRLYDPRIVDRFNEMFDKIVFNQKSYRK